MAQAQTTESEASFQLRELLSNNDVELKSRVLGTGSYSKVLVAYSNKLDRTVAVKKIDRRQKNEYIRRFLPREMKIVTQLNHPNVVKVFEVIKTKEYICMVEEFAGNGDLLRLIKSKKRIDELEGRLLFRQFVEGLKYLESLHILHRDLKCENLFLDEYNNLKIGDFGFARFMEDGEVSHTYCGSKAYVALEIMQSIEYSNNAVDIWSAGVVLYVMLTGIMPFDDRKPKEMMALQREHRIRFPHACPSDAARKLIYRMLHPDPRKRVNLTQIVASEWLCSTPYMMRGPLSADDTTCTTASNISQDELNKYNNNNED
ncbi:unnamed protein product [Bursaphelenchus okinawaensis]|uniref:Protein kinase domain-containing protein n=1 Tax=Bursaphelenchus okinawaensis TaxID=465554 RepID=A0A811KFP7_9BILA|nr:unnamed protein product [Bursaphelenchus okinawaensis]CAG9103622.1 unnamed protein product [Bursaphelenchus okinawaensis]